VVGKLENCSFLLLGHNTCLDNARQRATYVLYNHNQKKNHTAKQALAAALYGTTWAPGTGPLLRCSAAIWVVFCRALMAVHINRSEMAAAKQTKN